MNPSNIDLNSEIIKIFPNTRFDADLQVCQNYLKPAGKARMLCYAKDSVFEFIPTLSAIAKLKRQFNFPVKVIGGHSNLLFTEKGFEGLVLIVDCIPAKSEDIEIIENQVIVKKPVPLSYLISVLTEKGLDISHLTGIPGTVFSAVLNNSGTNTTGMSIASNNTVSRIVTYDLQEDCEKIFMPDTSFFVIRGSLLKDLNYRQTRYVITQVELCPQKVATAIIKEKISQINVKRTIVNQEGWSFHTAGSFWSNGHAMQATGKKVRELLQETGQFTKIENGIGYSPNFGFLYTSAITTDQQLAEYTKMNFDAVKTKFNFELHKEVEIIDHDGQITIEEFWKRCLK